MAAHEQDVSKMKQKKGKQIEHREREEGKEKRRSNERKGREACKPNWCGPQYHP